MQLQFRNLIFKGVFGSLELNNLFVFHVDLAAELLDLRFHVRSFGHILLYFDTDLLLKIVDFLLVIFFNPLFTFERRYLELLQFLLL